MYVGVRVVLSFSFSQNTVIDTDLLASFNLDLYSFRARADSVIDTALPASSQRLGYLLTPLHCDGGPRKGLGIATLLESPIMTAILYIVMSFGITLTIITSQYVTQHERKPD